MKKTEDEGHEARGPTAQHKPQALTSFVDLEGDMDARDVMPHRHAEPLIYLVRVEVGEVLHE